MDCAPTRGGTDEDGSGAFGKRQVQKKTGAQTDDGDPPSELELPAHSVKALKQARISNVWELSRKTEAELLAIPGIGVKTAGQILEKVRGQAGPYPR